MRLAAALRREESADVRRQARLDRVLVLAEAFVHDLGLMMAGARPRIEGYVAADASARLQAALSRGSARVTPMFSEYAQVRVDGDLLDTAQPARVTVEFVDLSLPSQNDVASRRPRRRVRLRLVLDPALATVLDVRVELADPSPP